LPRVGRVGVRQFLLHPVIDRRKVRCRGHYQCMRWRAQRAVGTVDLPASGTAANEAKITDRFGGTKALEDKGHPWVKTVWGTLVIGRYVEALRGHAGPSHRLGRASHAPPHAAELTGKAVIVLAAFGEPGADAILSTAHLDHAGQLRVIRRAPVKTIATEVDEAPTLVLVRRNGIEHALGGVFRMRARHDALIGGQQGYALSVEIVFSNHVIAKTLSIEPVDDVGIGWELPQSLLGAHIQHRPQA